MKVIRTFEDLRQERPKITGSLGLVPTMGALHEGHISLIEAIRPKVDAVMATIFVNPTQFGANEDFSKYPRQEHDDLAKLEGLADFVYLPQAKDIYPEGEKITVKAGENAKGLCGDFRPNHFDGVCTVVSTLFDQTKPDIAAFGEKDYQQLMVIKEHGAWSVEHGKHFPEVIGVPTLREPDGLAMSSRNAYLSAEERVLAPMLYKELSVLRMAGGDNFLNAKRQTLNALEEAGFKVQYLEQRWNRLLIAAYLGKTRLIDNIHTNICAVQ